MIKAVRNPDNNDLLEITYPAKLKTVSSSVRHTKDEKQTPYRLCTADIEYPNGDTDTIGALLWDTSYEMFKETFVEGADISLRIQVEGEYAGNAVIQLPAMNKANVAKFEFTFEEEKEEKKEEVKEQA